MRYSVLIVMIIFISACNPEPEPIHFGEDQCAYCKMGIADKRFGSELVTEKGKVYKFDALECQIDYIQENDKEYAYELVVPFDDPGKLHPVRDLTHVIDKKIKSPMGAYLSSWKDIKNYHNAAFKTSDDADILNWEELVEKRKR